MKLPSPTTQIYDDRLDKKKIKLWVKRDDLIHPHISGNKWRKLKYNFQAADVQKADRILTFGGAYSNHIVATAAAGKKFGKQTLGLIRGNEFKHLNASLRFAKEAGMQFLFLTRAEYNKKEQQNFIAQLREKYANAFIIPEGGANQYGVLGCEEILQEEQESFDYICCAAGTGTTAAGILKSMNVDQKLFVFPALKGGEGLYKDIMKWQSNADKRQQLHLICDYHFGGFAKINQELVYFVNDFYLHHELALDLIYTGKMMFGLMDLIQKNHFPQNSKILFIHSGGLQANKGLEERYNVKLYF